MATNTVITNRLLTPEDEANLTVSLALDKEHPELEAEFFAEPGCVTNVYEDESGPICYVRGSAALRLDIHYRDNNAGRRNLLVMLENFPKLTENARLNGFKEIIFQSNSSLLVKFCVKRLGFIESCGELRKAI